MKRIILSILTMSALLCGCQKDQVSDVSRKQGIIQATIEEMSSTRTVMDEHNNIRWSEGDQIVGFMRSTLGVKYQVSAASVGKTSASFEEVSSGGLNAGTELEHIIAYYPYSSSVSAAKSGSNYTLDVVLPTEQTYVAESFGNGAMPMVAVSETNNITFRNVCGGMKLQLKGTQKVASIKVEGKNGELLSGSATVTAYTDETKPAITMASDASTSVTLNCGDGVQLNESTATEFILAMPPVLFSKGFTVIITDSSSQTYTVETDKANAVFRSSILVMPKVNLDNSSDSDSGDDDELIIPVVTVSLNSTSLKLFEGDKVQLIATVLPKDATDQNVVWSSDSPTIATVSQDGLITAVSAGKAKISAIAGGKFSSCTITVSALEVVTDDYIDEYGINHGPGIVLGQIVWAPVNCGYHATDFKYGKLYQWGRRYGQGYEGDACLPTIEEGGISEISGNHKDNANVFYIGMFDGDSGADWAYPSNDFLWNSGSELNPVKTEFDPCPDGWRVPTNTELSEITNIDFSYEKNASGQYGFNFNINSMSDEKAFFLPAAGGRYYEGSAYPRNHGRYWSSMRYYNMYNDWERGNSIYLYLSSNTSSNTATLINTDGSRAMAFSVRCVHE